MIRKTPIAIGTALVAALAASPVMAQQAAPLQVPAKSVPVPADVSPQMSKIIGLPLRTNWDIHPKDGAAWKPVAEAAKP
ncbi:hypothetical protein [Methylobacterium planeticum]|uniref:hypothetical protein n=1 Tax=Methylobacterium planeticum TaxID=2615211 RepID=UPI001FED99B2|nr:hypothetical protein [Methylobacterium planeticum]